MADLSEKCVHEMVKACSCYFKEIDLINEYINKVSFFESEIDTLEVRLKQHVFSNGRIERLSHKIHLRYFIEKVALISDIAEDVCDRLSVYAIKRSM